MSGKIGTFNVHTAAAVKSFLGIGEEEHGRDSEIDFAIQLCAEQVLNYINCDKIPVELDMTFVVIVAKWLENSGGRGDVKSVKRGDVQVQFDTEKSLIMTDFFGCRAALDSVRRLKN